MPGERALPSDALPSRRAAAAGSSSRVLLHAIIEVDRRTAYKIDLGLRSAHLREG